MPYTTLVAGTTITASWANANVRDQGVTPFANTAARAAAITAPIEGMVSHLNDTNELGVYSGLAWSHTGPMHGAWTTGTGAVSGMTIGNGTVSMKYARVGRAFLWKCKVVFGSSTVVTGQIGVQLPTTAEAGLNAEYHMSAYAFDASTGARYPLLAWSSTTSSVLLSTLAQPAVATSPTVPFTWASGDGIVIGGVMEAAADS